MSTTEYRTHRYVLMMLTIVMSFDIKYCNRNITTAYADCDHGVIITVQSQLLEDTSSN
jgi:hypothetical protein